MADWFPALDPTHVEFVRAQHVFFVATAPCDGFPNLSPKGYDSLEIVSPRELVFVDLPGSGNQTASHLAEHDRLTLMFASFGPKPMILRIYGRARVVKRDGKDFALLAAKLRPGMVGPHVRHLIAIEIEKLQTSCGYAVPRYDFVGERETLHRYYENKVANGEFDAMLERASRAQAPV
jgi:hypothetical protein